MDDYFAGSGARPQSPAPLSTTPLTTTPLTTTAWAPAPGAATAPPGYPPYQVAQQWSPPQGGGVPKAIWVVVGALGSLVVTGILAAIAIPVFLDQRYKAEAARTTVSAPTSVDGMPHLTDARSAEMEARLQALPGPGDHVAGIYGSGGVVVGVGAAHYPVRPGEQQGFLDEAAREATVQGVPVSDVSPGRLGGKLQCGRHATLPMTICVFADAGSYGFVLVTGPAPDPVGTARAAREAFVHRS